jgi:hypothetical protein
MDTREAWQTLVVPQAGFDQTFQAARDVLADEYPIAEAQPADGLIRTEYKRFDKTGAQRAAGAYITGGNAQRHRRRAVCRVLRSPSGGAVELRVDLQRESTSQADTLLLGSEGADRRQAGARRRWEYDDARTSTHWADIGRDTAEESRLLDLIRRRLESKPVGTAM